MTRKLKTSAVAPNDPEALEYLRLRAKVAHLLGALDETRVRALSKMPSRSAERVREAFAPLIGKRKAKDLAFHLFDWSEEAAFLVALALFPGRFSHDEIVRGLAASLCHFPNHAAAAAKLWGTPVSDVFELNVFEDEG